ncbi:helix-turn-helix domain-containing protein [Kitasatospora sp. NPDC056800]|uniref:helix-turn-helix domain-containing protein n=1 Tax=Kitasatospora sp. NPDC056800 TaxID=3345948 RepID=UPI0036A2C42F
MQIHRIPQHAPGYTILDNGHVVRKHSLSWAARGLLSYLLSLPDGAREDVRTLAAKSVEGRTSVARALRELEAAGHYVRRTQRDPLTGQVRTVVSVHEVPVTTGKAVHAVPPLPVPPAAGCPAPGKPGVGKAGSPSKERETKGVEEPSVRPPEKLTAGMALLLELGCREPKMALAGKPLGDQAARVERLLAQGWSRSALLGILAAPLPEKVTHSVGAVLAGRLARVPAVPEAAGGTGPRRHECPGRGGMCGRPVAGPGQVCGACRACRA